MVGFISFLLFCFFAVRTAGFLGSSCVRGISEGHFAGRRMLPLFITLACALSCFGVTSVTADLLEAEVRINAKSHLSNAN